MKLKETLIGLFCSDPHNRVIRLLLASMMDDREDLVMLPLTRITIAGKEQEEKDVAYAYTRADLLHADFVPACCKIGFVANFEGEFVTGCAFGWARRRAENKIFV